MFSNLKPAFSRTLLILLCTVFTTTACAVSESHEGPGDRGPALTADHVIAHDGYRLPLHTWTTENEPRGIVLALHGFNDYGNAFSVLSEGFNTQGFNLYAYDQRGFGATDPAGIWPGQDKLVKDAITTLNLLRQRYPEQPLYLMGKSMGGGISILALTAEEPADVDGSILIAPAVWSPDTMPWYQRFSLWVGAGVAPGLSLSVNLGQRLGIRASDDDAVLQSLAEDPLVQGESRVDTIDGLAELMGAALEASHTLPGPSLILYGDEDHIIPPEPFCHLLDRLPDPAEKLWRMVVYPDGYHMLTRYSGSEQVHEDILAFISDPGGALPSGHERNRAEAKAILCD